MVCHKCGSENVGRASICSTCGATLISMPKGSGRIEPIPSALLQSSRLPVVSSEFPSDELPPGAFDADAYAAAIGPKATEYYLDEFEEIHRGGNGSWHWPAFFVTLFWLMRRRMWGKAVLYIVISWLLSIVGAGLVAASPGLGAVYQIALMIAFFVVPAKFANRLYFKHCTRLIEAAKQSARSRDHALGIVGGKGGTSGAAFAFALVFVFVGVVGMLAAVAIPAYQDYTMRAKATEVIVAMAPSRVAINEYYDRTGRLPATLQDTGVGYPSASRYGSAVEYDAGSGAISTRAELSASVKALIVMRPLLSKDGRMTWSCGSPDLAAKYLPKTCRATP